MAFALVEQRGEIAWSENHTAWKILTCFDPVSMVSETVWQNVAAS